MLNASSRRTGFIGRMLMLTALMVLLTGCGGNVDRDVTSPLEREAGIGITRDDERPVAQGVPTWEDTMSGAFSGNASGTAVVYEKGGFRNLRMEGFALDGCERARVYLSDGRERIDLGDLQHMQGEQGYGIPSFVDIETYEEVVIWCVSPAQAVASAQLR